MRKDENNFAFIDSQNLNLSIRELGWKLDFGRFRRYLQDKYFVSKAYLFVGYVEGNNDLYTTLLKFKLFRPYLRYMNELIDKLAYNHKKKKPHKDETL